MRHCGTLVILLAALPLAAFAQTTADAKPTVNRYVCPGDPPGNLASFDCNFTPGKRFEEFVADGLTDKAIVGAVAFGTIAQMRDSRPTEWTGGSGWRKRVGTNYAQNLAKSLTAYGVGALVRDDRRHVRCEVEPKVGPKSCTVARRIGHVFLDWATVRRSTRTGDGKRMPNVAMFMASGVSATVGNLWYPPSGRSRQQTVSRFTSSLSSALLASASNEFAPDLGRGFARLVGKLAGTQHEPKPSGGRR